MNEIESVNSSLERNKKGAFPNENALFNYYIYKFVNPIEIRRLDYSKLVFC